MGHSRMFERGRLIYDRLYLIRDSSHSSHRGTFGRSIVSFCNHLNSDHFILRDNCINDESCKRGVCVKIEIGILRNRDTYIL